MFLDRQSLMETRRRLVRIDRAHRAAEERRTPERELAWILNDAALPRGVRLLAAQVTYRWRRARRIRMN